MEVTLKLFVEGVLVSDTPRGIFREGPDGRDQILKPDIITLQTRQGGERSYTVCRVVAVSVDGKAMVRPSKETPEEYVMRLFTAYRRKQRRLTGDLKQDRSVLLELEDIERKVIKICNDRGIVNPLTEVKK